MVPPKAPLAYENNLTRITMSVRESPLSSQHRISSATHQGTLREDHDDTAEPVLRRVGRGRRGPWNPAAGVLAAGRRADGGDAARARPRHTGEPHAHAFRRRGDVLRPPRPAGAPKPARRGGARPWRGRLLPRGPGRDAHVQQSD